MINCLLCCSNETHFFKKLVRDMKSFSLNVLSPLILHIFYNKIKKHLGNIQAKLNTSSVFEQRQLNMVTLRI